MKECFCPESQPYKMTVCKGLRSDVKRCYVTVWDTQVDWNSPSSEFCWLRPIQNFSWLPLQGNTILVKLPHCCYNDAIIQKRGPVLHKLHNHVHSKLKLVPIEKENGVNDSPYIQVYNCTQNNLITRTLTPVAYPWTYYYTQTIIRNEQCWIQDFELWSGAKMLSESHKMWVSPKLLLECNTRYLLFLGQLWRLCSGPSAVYLYHIHANHNTVHWHNPDGIAQEKSLSLHRHQYSNICSYFLYGLDWILQFRTS